MQRLTSASDIKAHSFFAELDWAQFQTKSYETPYRPREESDSDTEAIDSKEDRILFGDF